MHGSKELHEFTCQLKVIREHNPITQKNNFNKNMQFHDRNPIEFATISLMGTGYI